MMANELTWRYPPDSIGITSAEVHVWRASVVKMISSGLNLWQIIDKEEQKRANRFVFQKNRDQFTVAHAVLRLILGRYLNKEPHLLNFCFNQYGKPRLAGESGCSVLFNISHSHDLVLIAIASGREVGVDIEYTRDDLADVQIAERFFSDNEVAVLKSLPVEHQKDAFFNCWTRKEAFIKAKGKGLSIPLDSFDVSLTPNEPATLLSTRIDPGEVQRWRLQELEPGSGYRAALVVAGHDWQLKCWQYPD